MKTLILSLQGYTHLIIILHSLALSKNSNLLDSLNEDSLDDMSGFITNIPTGASLYALTDYHQGYFRLYCHNSDYEYGITKEWLEVHGIPHEVESKKAS
jgi:hypothetical protein